MQEDVCVCTRLAQRSRFLFSKQLQPISQKGLWPGRGAGGERDALYVPGMPGHILLFLLSVWGCSV